MPRPRPLGLLRGRVAGLAPAVLSSWRDSLALASGGAAARVLAWAPSGADVALGSPGYLSVGGPLGWTHVGWHTIERGGWNVENGQLQWRTYAGGRGSVQLTPPRRLPELFRERVSASLVVEQVTPFRGSRGIIVSGRRDLGDDTAPLAWHATLSRGLTWSTDGVEDAAEAALIRLRAEYDIA
ncbi:MAG: hypothetical protein ACR2LI_03540 [Propionibacteriaceae bacterium]